MQQSEGAASTDFTGLSFIIIIAQIRQTFKHLDLFGKTLVIVLVHAAYDLLQEFLVFFNSVKISAAAKDQGLVNSILEKIIALFNIAIFMGTGWIGL